MSVTWNYAAGLVWFLFILCRNLLIGTLFTKKEQPWYCLFIYGYLAVSFCAAVIIIPVSGLKLPFILFEIAYGLSQVALIIAALVHLHKTERFLSFSDLLKRAGKAIEENWFVFLLIGLAMFIMMFRVTTRYENFTGDEAYYINEIGFYLHSADPWGRSFATGFPLNKGLVSLERLFYAQGAENAFSVHLFGFVPSFFTRFILNVHGYFLMICCLLWLGSLMEGKCQKQNPADLGSVLMLLFLISQDLLKSIGLLDLFNIQMFQNTMYFGSNIVRTCGLFFLLLPAVNQKEFTFSFAAMEAAIGLVLMSRSSGALPLFAVALMAWLLYHPLSTGEYLHFGVAALVILTASLLACLIPVPEPVVEDYWNGMNSMGARWLFNIALIALALMMFARNSFIRRWNLLLLLCAILIMVPFINQIPLQLCFFAFIQKRLFSALISTVIFTAGIEVFWLFSSQRIVSWGIAVLTGAICTVTVFMGISIYESKGDDGYPQSLGQLLQNTADNPLMMPQTQIALGEEVARLSEGKTVTVYGTRETTVEGIPSDFSHLLGLYAPDIINLMNVPRFDMPYSLKTDWLGVNMTYHMLSVNDQSKPESVEKYNRFLNENNVNMLIFTDDNHDALAEYCGFHLVSVLPGSDPGRDFKIYMR